MVEAGEMQSMIPTKVTLEDRLKSLINKSPLMIFMKGDRKVNIYLRNDKAQFINFIMDFQTPKCGFSRQLMEIMADLSLEFETFDIFSDEDVRQGLKSFSNWPTYPQVYVKGELIGGLDIIKELKEADELVPTLKGEA